MRLTLNKFAPRVAVAVLIVVGGWTSAAVADSAPPPPGAVCTWGGTAAAPTGTFAITPGLTNVPLARPAAFSAPGELAGDPGCTGMLVYKGQIDAGGTCSFNTFEGKAQGIPTVTDFAGVGVGPLGPAGL